MAGHADRQEEAGRVEHAAVQALQGAAVDRVVDGLAHELAAERLGFDVQEEVLARDGRLLGVAFGGLGLRTWASSVGGIVSL